MVLCRQGVWIVGIKQTSDIECGRASVCTSSGTLVGSCSTQRATGHDPSHVIKDPTSMIARFRMEISLEAMTGYSDAVMRRKIKEAGFDHHLVKPAGWPDLEYSSPVQPKADPAAAPTATSPRGEKDRRLIPCKLPG
jgi:hypothetical protein